jgi:hypothetical protein
MSRERWDVVLWFPEGPMSAHGDMVCRGPVIRMGLQPGPGGLEIEGYRGLDDRQAVITAYDGGTVSLAPVGMNQVRVSPHPHVNWSDILPIKGPEYLTKGDVFHLGPPGRGCTIHFVECRRLGDWEQQRVMSDAGSAEEGELDPTATVKPSDVKELQASKWPAWFLPGMGVIAVLILVALGAPIIGTLVEEPDAIGPVAAGMPHFDEVVVTPADLDAQLNLELYEGLEQGWAEFVAKPNADAARDRDLLDRDMWDEQLFKYTAAETTWLAKSKRFWQRLEAVRDEYGYVVTQLQNAGMPEVMAGIPYSESRYGEIMTSPVCAGGYWQFMPEVANRVDLRVEGCTIRGRKETWQPTKIAVGGAMKAIYVDKARPVCTGTASGERPQRSCCKITQCDIDQRDEIESSTRGAITLLQEAWNDPTCQESGGCVQMTITGHNAGWNDAPHYPDGLARRNNVLPSYLRYLDATGQDRDPSFVGQSVKCQTNDFRDRDRCDSELHQHAQHYAYKVIAEHLLAVCYYAHNYPDEPAFKDWAPFVGRGGYCGEFKIPERELVLSWQ